MDDFLKVWGNITLGLVVAVTFAAFLWVPYHVGYEAGVRDSKVAAEARGRRQGYHNGYFRGWRNCSNGRPYNADQEDGK